MARGVSEAIWYQSSLYLGPEKNSIRGKVIEVICSNMTFVRFKSGQAMGCCFINNGKVGRGRKSSLTFLGGHHASNIAPPPS